MTSPNEKKTVRMSNGIFPVCPNCSRPMAMNACGYGVCLIGCGYTLDRETTQALLDERRKEDGKTNFTQ